MRQVPHVGLGSPNQRTVSQLAWDQEFHRLQSFGVATAAIAKFFGLTMDQLCVLLDRQIERVEAPDHYNLPYIARLPHPAICQLIITAYRKGLDALEIACMAKTDADTIDAVLQAWRLRVLAVSYECGLWPIEPKGRPIDMGGPRDVWIDFEPWDSQCDS